MEKFKHEKNFLENYTTQKNELLSILELSDGHNLTPMELRNKKKFFEFFSNAKQFSDGVSYFDSIFMLFGYSFYVILHYESQAIIKRNSKVSQR